VGRTSSRTLRVVHVISTPEGVGGAGRAMAEVVRASCHRGDEVLVLNPFLTLAGLRQTPTGRLVIDAKKIKALGSKVPLRSRGERTRTGPWSVMSVLAG
jgi:hypothetical protein